MIDSYSFGRMGVDGHKYRKDLIILTDGTVIHPWWRTSGHKLVMNDIKQLLDTSPEILVIGTGSPGMMTPDPELIAKLESQGIQVIVLPTKQAVTKYNILLKSGEKVSACFHLTC